MKSLIVHILCTKNQIKTISECTSVKAVEYIPCSNFWCVLIGETEAQLFIAEIGDIFVFEVTATWMCLKRQHIQDARISIREIR